MQAQEVRNVLASCSAALAASAEQLEARAAGLRAELSATLAAFEDVGTQADAIAAEVRPALSLTVTLLAEEAAAF